MERTNANHGSGFFSRFTLLRVGNFFSILFLSLLGLLVEKWQGLNGNGGGLAARFECGFGRTIDSLLLGSFFVGSPFNEGFNIAFGRLLPIMSDKIMGNARKPNNDSGLNFGAQLWPAADEMRGHMDASEYKHVCLGLIFLKFISDAFEEKREQLLLGFSPARSPHCETRCCQENCWCLPN